MSDTGWSDPGVLVLGSLAGGAKHGWAITNDIEATTGTRLGPGTLYGALARLESSGLVRALPAEDRRKPYELTAAGALVLRAKAEAMRSFSRTALRRLGTEGAP
ncbi:MAG TPA: PadR family transcriptional regulator [Candidatus Nanopelagicales bacterium]|nr:PadR family transcriptional regulator [Candidatus Nanopelagicales bacterium]